MKSKKRIQSQIEKLNENTLLNKDQISTLKWVLEDDTYDIINPNNGRLFNGSTAHVITFNRDGSIEIWGVKISKITPKLIFFDRDHPNKSCNIKFEIIEHTFIGAFSTFLPFLDESDVETIRSIEFKFIDRTGIDFEKIDDIIEKIRDKYKLDKNKAVIVY